MKNNFVKSWVGADKFYSGSMAFRLVGICGVQSPRLIRCTKFGHFPSNMSAESAS